MSEKAATHRITYVVFTTPVTMDGDAGAITYWSQEKWGKSIEVEERGPFIYLYTLKRDDKGTLARTGTRRRVPITSVGYIAEVPL